MVARNKNEGFGYSGFHDGADSAKGLNRHSNYHLSLFSNWVRFNFN